MDDDMSVKTDTKVYSASTSTVTPLLTRPAGVRQYSAKAFDTFRRGSGPEHTFAPALGKNGRVFDPKAAAWNTANSPLVRRLKGRHLQMIAIGGSIGKQGIRSSSRAQLLIRVSLQAQDFSSEVAAPLRQEVQRRYY